MTEFRRATTAVEEVEGLVAELAGASPDDVSAELRVKFDKARGQLSELASTAERMRKKCEARAELEAIKEQLRAQLPGTPEDPLRAIQESVDAGEPIPEAMKPLVDRATELDALATYGSKMVEKVLALLERFATSRLRFDSEVVPRLGQAADSQAAEEASRKAAAEQEAAAAAQEAARIAEEEARRPVAELIAADAARLRAQDEAERLARKRLADEEAARLQAEAAVAAEEEALLRLEQEGERRLTEDGPEAACAEALIAMLGCPVGTYREAIEALRDMIGSIASEPQDPRRRMVRLANEGFQQRLGRVQGVWLFLRGTGFTPKYRRDMPEALITALGLGPGPPTERFLMLEEPDMLSAYEEWSAWHGRIKVIANFLEDLGRLAQMRTAHLGRHGLDVPTQGVLPASVVLQRWEAKNGS